MKYRGREEIVASILLSAKENDGITKTKLVHDSFVSHQQLSYYLESLVNNGLLAHDIGNKAYYMTRKGSEFLELYDKIVNLLKNTQLVVAPTIKWK